MKKIKNIKNTYKYGYKLDRKTGEIKRRRIPIDQIDIEGKDSFEVQKLLKLILKIEAKEELEAQQNE